MQGNYYEHVPYEETNYLFAVGRESYAMPHIHPEFEIGMILEGAALIKEGNETQRVSCGDLMALNAYQCHEYFAEGSAYFTFLILQVAPSFFRPFLSRIDRLRFDGIRVGRDQIGEERYDQLVSILSETAMTYFRRDPLYELDCAGSINYFFHRFLDAAPHTWLSDEELRMHGLRVSRMNRLNAFIEEHASEKIVLGDLADAEGLTLNYLSHFFKEAFGTPFQSHLQRIRCRRAAELLTETDRTMTEISEECGFSALKYMNAGFRNVFQMSPAEYRRQYRMQDGQHETAQTVRSVLLPDRPRKGFTPHFSARQSLQYLQDYTVPVE